MALKLIAAVLMGVTVGCAEPLPPTQLTCSPVSIPTGEWPLFRVQRVATTELEYRALFTAVYRGLSGDETLELPARLNPSPFVDADLGVPGVDGGFPIVIAGPLTSTGLLLQVSNDRLWAIPSGEERRSGSPVGEAEVEARARKLLERMPWTGDASAWRVVARGTLQGTSGPDGTTVTQGPWYVFAFRTVRGAVIEDPSAFIELNQSGFVVRFWLPLIVPRLVGAAGEELPCDGVGSIAPAPRDELQRRFEFDVRTRAARFGGVEALTNGSFVYRERGETGLFEPWFEAVYVIDQPGSDVVPRGAVWQVRADGRGAPTR